MSDAYNAHSSLYFVEHTDDDTKGEKVRIHLHGLPVIHCELVMILWDREHFEDTFHPVRRKEQFINMLQLFEFEEYNEKGKLQLLVSEGLVSKQQEHIT
jgi:hypothetical protein